MASIQREVLIDVSADALWSAVRDVGALHTRLVRGFVTDCRLEEGNARVVTFANGLVAREVIVNLDDEARRLVWSATGGRLVHHNASVQVFALGPEQSRLVWIADLLPDAMAPAIGGMIEAATAAMKRTVEGGEAGPP